MLERAGVTVARGCCSVPPIAKGAMDGVRGSIWIESLVPKCEGPGAPGQKGKLDDLIGGAIH